MIGFVSLQNSYNYGNMKINNMDKKTEKHILNILRQGTVTWHARNNCLNKNRRYKIVGKYKNGNDEKVLESPCGMCGEWFEHRANELEVDHIEPVGPFNGDFHEYVFRMFCDEDNLQALCFVCHKKKSAKDVANMRCERKTKTSFDDEDLL